MALFRSKWMRFSLEKSIEAVNKLSDQKELYLAVKESPHAAVRIAAVDKMDEQAVLEKIALYNDDVDVRTAAVMKVENEEVLVQVIMHDQSFKAPKAAIKRMKNEYQLRHILQCCNSMYCVYIEDRLNELKVQRLEILRRRPDQAEMADKALHARDYHERVQAIEMLGDQALLEKLVMQYDSCSALSECWHALMQMTDEAALKRIISQSKRTQVKAYAMGRLLEISDAGAVSIDDALIDEMLKDPFSYSDCIKQIYRKTTKYRTRISSISKTHEDRGYRSDNCHHDAHFDLSERMNFRFN